MSIHWNLPGVTGESSDRRHVGWIDVIDLSWGTKRRIGSSTSTRRDRESANAEISDLTLTKFVDASTPALFLESCCGTGKIHQIALTQSGHGTGATEFGRYELHHAMISSYRVEHMALRRSTHVRTPRPVERITLSFVSLELTYVEHDDDGLPVTPVTVGFDASTNARL